MLISYNWLKEFIPNLTEKPNEVAEKLSRSLAEVEEAKQVGDDFVFEIENKALGHRPDLFGEAGLAREVAAVLEKEFKPPEPRTLEKSAGRVGKPDQLKIKIFDKQLCPRYSGVILEDVQISDSPEWLKQRLISVGMRPINNIVDITNYLMFKHNQPLHAFDLDQLSQKWPGDKVTISVRLAREGEVLVLLDDTELTLTEQDLIIAHQTNSDSYPIALAGIMGGKSAEVTPQTKNILLESANFNMFSVRASSRYHSIRSEASLRFEKGIDAQTTLPALSEAIRMISGQDQPEAIVDQNYSVKNQPTRVELELSSVNSYLNTQMPDDEILGKLDRLGFEAERKKQDAYEVTVPSSRPDVKIKEDLFEEIGRLYDYNKIELTFPTRTTKPPAENLLWDFKYQIRDIMSKLGLTEELNYSFVDQKHSGLVTDIVGNQTNLEQKFDPEELKLQNSSAPENAYLRSSLLPSLTQNILDNAKRFYEFGLYEIGLVTHPKPNQLPVEPDLLGLIYFSGESSQPEVLQKTKSLWVTLLDKLNIYNDLVNLIPVRLDLGETQGFAYGYEIEVTTLFEQHEPVKFSEIPVSPPTIQDLSFYIDEKQTVGPLLEDVQTNVLNGQDWLEKIEVIDVFQNEKLKSDQKKSITLRLTFQHPEKSLPDKEVSLIREKIEEFLSKNYNATIR